MAVENPRWPHTCKVYRMRGVSNFSKGEQEIIYEGPCRKYGNTSIRTFTGNDGVQRADYALSIPGQIRGISTGVLIDDSHGLIPYELGYYCVLLSSEELEEA